MTIRPSWQLPIGSSGITLLFALYWLLAFPYFEQVRNANEQPRILQSMALVEDGSWSIDGPISKKFDPGPDISRNPSNGKIYPNKAPGTSIVGVFAYGFAKISSSVFSESLSQRFLTWSCRFWGGLLPSLIIVAVAWRRYAKSSGPLLVFWALCIYGFATPVASYMRLFYGHQLAACFLFLGVGLLSDAIGQRKWSLAGFGGALAGIAVAVEYGAVFAGIPIAVALVLGIRQGISGIKVAGAAWVGAIFPIVLLAAYHEVAFGSPVETGYHHVMSTEFAAKHGQGFLGLSFPSFRGIWVHILAPGGGIVWWAPLVFLALYGLLQLSFGTSEHKIEAQIHLAIFLLIFAVGCSLVFDGGWRVGPRYIIVAMPGLILGWAHILGQIRSSILGMGFFAAIFMYSLFVNVYAATLWPHFDLSHCNSPVVEVLLPLLDEDYQPYGVAWWMQLEQPGWLTYGVPIVCAWLAMAKSVVFGIRMLLAVLVGSIVGYAAVYTLPLLHSTDLQGTANLRYIQRVYEPSPGSFRSRASRTIDKG